jgi:hypothetical protein
LEAFENYRNAKFGVSLLLGWALIEQIVQDYWLNKLEKIKKDVEKNLYKSTEKYNACSEDDKIHKNIQSIAVQTQFLYKADIIDKELFEELNQLRVKRNKIVHKGLVINRINGGRILVVIRRLVEVLYAVKAKYQNPGWHFNGKWGN